MKDELRGLKNEDNQEKILIFEKSSSTIKKLKGEINTNYIQFESAEIECNLLLGIISELKKDSNAENLSKKIVTQFSYVDSLKREYL